jgi:hypothetical protein
MCCATWGSRAANDHSIDDEILGIAGDRVRTAATSASRVADHRPGAGGQAGSEDEQRGGRDTKGVVRRVTECRGHAGRSPHNVVLPAKRVAWDAREFTRGMRQDIPCEDCDERSRG